jgi:hypothetical protein
MSSMLSYTDRSNRWLADPNQTKVVKGMYRLYRRCEDKDGEIQEDVKEIHAHNKARRLFNWIRGRSPSAYKSPKKKSKTPSKKSKTTPSKKSKSKSPGFRPVDVEYVKPKSAKKNTPKLETPRRRNPRRAAAAK